MLTSNNLFQLIHLCPYFEHTLIVHLLFVCPEQTKSHEEKTFWLTFVVLQNSPNHLPHQFPLRQKNSLRGIFLVVH